MPARLAAGSRTNRSLPAHPFDCQLVPKACCSLWQFTVHTPSALPPFPVPASIPIPCRSNVGLPSHQRGSCRPEHPPLWSLRGSAWAAGWADTPPRLYEVLPAWAHCWHGHVSSLCPQHGEGRWLANAQGKVWVSRAHVFSHLQPAFPVERVGFPKPEMDDVQLE